MPRTRTAATRRSSCPIAGALDLLGDRWTLVLIRDLFAGKQRYGEFEASAEGIPTNILADRLARLEAAGVITTAPYQQNPPRYAYRLTPNGEDLRSVLAALAGWGLRHVAGTRPNPTVVAALATDPADVSQSRASSARGVPR
jgi:DNA-binding HxlR family transcriptional regulator